MFSHVLIGSNDLARAQRFYDAVLGTLGAGPPLRNVSASGKVRLFYSHEGGLFGIGEPNNGEEATIANGGTIGFRCASPEAVKTFHDVAVAHGGTAIEDPPGLRDGNMGPLHLAYVRDPDGHKLCAVYRGR